MGMCGCSRQLAPMPRNFWIASPRPSCWPGKLTLRGPRLREPFPRPDAMVAGRHGILGMALEDIDRKRSFITVRLKGARDEHCMLGPQKHEPEQFLIGRHSRRYRPNPRSKTAMNT